MTLLERDELMREEGREEGRKEGFKEGREEEHKNTERERLRAEAAMERIKVLEEQLQVIQQSLKK